MFNEFRVPYAPRFYTECSCQSMIDELQIFIIDNKKCKYYQRAKWLFRYGPLSWVFHHGR